MISIRIPQILTAWIAEDSGTWVARVAAWLQSLLGPTLRSWHAPFDAWLGKLPMSVAMGCALGLYLIAVVWVWTLKPEFIFRGAPDRKWWRDLRIWATLIVLPYMGVYWFLGR